MERGSKINTNPILRSTNTKALAQASHSPTVSFSNTTPPNHPSPPNRTISPPWVPLRRYLIPFAPLSYTFLTYNQGVIYFVSPVAVLALQRWPYRRLLITVLGLALIVIGLISASFATCVSDLIVSQGVLYGIGGALLYNPFVFYLDEWFIARKGLAFGILWAGTGIGGMVVPVVMEWSLGKYGFRMTLRMWAVAVVSRIKVTTSPGSNGMVSPLAVRPNNPLDLSRQTTLASSPQGNAPPAKPSLLSHRDVLDPPTRKHYRRIRVLYAIDLLAQ